MQYTVIHKNKHESAASGVTFANNCVVEGEVCYPRLPFGASVLSLERVKPDMSNLVCTVILTSASAIDCPPKGYVQVT